MVSLPVTSAIVYVLAEAERKETLVVTALTDSVCLTNIFVYIYYIHSNILLTSQAVGTEKKWIINLTGFSKKYQQFVSNARIGR